MLESDTGDALTPSAAFSAWSSRKSDARRRAAGELRVEAEDEGVVDGEGCVYEMKEP